MKLSLDFKLVNSFISFSKNTIGSGPKEEVLALSLVVGPLFHFHRIFCASSVAALRQDRAPSVRAVAFPYQFGIANDNII